ncbi:hypothetical protein CDAR_512701 [Caerostris darwini]|uniref:Uncharacterized protein n=1 Tax=Caerostris darwini TaxID=1538125 RepID=A0AAV4SAP3_9ARAC|nr:hypothetical protein CDAR_512701 [Caerostris darwini]
MMDKYKNKFDVCSNKDEEELMKEHKSLRNDPDTSFHRGYSDSPAERWVSSPLKAIINCLLSVHLTSWRDFLQNGTTVMLPSMPIQNEGYKNKFNACSNKDEELMKEYKSLRNDPDTSFHTGYSDSPAKGWASSP